MHLPPLPTSVTVTVTAAHLAGGARGCPAECPLALALSEHDAIRTIPGAEIIVGGGEIHLYRGEDLVLVALTDRRTREWLERWDSDEEAAPFTSTLVFHPRASRLSADPVGGDATSAGRISGDSFREVGPDLSMSDSP